MLFVAVVSVSAQSGKVAQAHGETIPEIWHSTSQDKGAVIFSEDFASGIPATWSNVTVSGPVDWKYTTTGHTGDYPTAALLSTTSNNGWILVDSDADNFSGGGAEDAQLTTPIIDCSGFAYVKVEFQQMFRRWQQDTTIVRVTTNGGTTFTDYIINAAVVQAGTDNPDFVNIDITSAIAGNPANVQIQFRWKGAWDYGWQIDDVAIKEIDPNDLIIKKATLSEDVTYYKVPESQVQPLFFNAFAENIGYTDQTNVGLNIDVNDGASSVFTGSSPITAVLPVGSSDSLALSSTFAPSTVGTYTVTFNVSQTETDDVASNNSNVISFEVTDTVYAIDNGNYGGQWWNLEDSPGSSAAYELGVVYEVVADEYVTSASIYIGDNSVVGAIYEVALYVYDAGQAAYVLVDITDTYTINSGEPGGWVTVPFSADIAVTAGSDYLLSIIHYGGPDAVYIGYSTNSSFSGSTLSNDGNGAAWANQPRTPMMRLNFGEVGLKVNQINSGISMYPNPTDGIVTISNEGNPIKNVEIKDVTGKVIANLLNVTSIDFSSFSAGSYFVTFTTEKGIFTEKVIVK